MNNRKETASIDVLNINETHKKSYEYILYKSKLNFFYWIFGDSPCIYKSTYKSHKLFYHAVLFLLNVSLNELNIKFLELWIEFIINCNLTVCKIAF